MLNITKATAALDAVIKEIDAAYEAALQGGRKNPLLLNGLKPLSKAGSLAEKAKAKLTAAVEATTEKEKPTKEKKAADKK